MVAPTLSGLNAPTFGENTVNATPQVIDSDVTFADADNNFNGGTLVVSGLLTEDRISILSGVTISLSGGVVYYDADGAGAGAAVAIGTATGGAGSTFTVTFNASATSAMIDALIQNLTYANVSDAPTASRTLAINVTDASGASLSSSNAPSLTLQSGAANPWNAVTTTGRSAPAFADLDGDGDKDLLVGQSNGTFKYFSNTGTATSPVFVEQTGANNPLNGVNVTVHAMPVFGDVDLIVTNKNGGFFYYRNTGTTAAPTFTAQTGGSNPLNGFSAGTYASPALGDIDGDGDLDLMVGQEAGTVRLFRNTGSAAAPAFTEITGVSNPASVITGGTFSTNWATPALVDLNGDGDLDLIIGNTPGTFRYFENTGTTTSATYVERTGSANPLNGVQLNFGAKPSFVDIDGDGDMDMVAGDSNSGVLTYFRNSTAQGVSLTVNVTAQNDAPSGAGLPTDVTVTEDVASNLNLSAVTLTDVDTAGAITVVLTASAGTMTATTGGGVTVSNAGTGALTLSGTATAIDTFLNTASNIQYTGASNASGDNAATLTVTANDGSGAVTLGTINIDITAVNDRPTLAGLASSVVFAENTVNAAPQLLDASVVFADIDGALNGGSLTVSGLLAEDTVSVRDEGTGAGQIGLSGGNVTYGGVIIGTLAGGAGGTLTITLNTSATIIAVDALIQNLTYANSSDTPTASRTLTLNVNDGDGGTLSAPPTIVVEVTAETDAVIGTAASETLAGSSVADTIDGGDGDDILNAGDGDDTLIGGAGADRLRGGAGADAMAGGTGDDIYVVDNVGDTTDETGGDGIDTVASTISWTLNAGFENLTLAGSGAINGTGNGADNVILGNCAANILSGLDGNDTLSGDGGNDTLNGGDGADSLDGSVGNDNLNGGAGTDTLIGGAGNDTLDGGLGADSMTGGLGNDSFVVDDAADAITEASGEGTDSVSASISYSLTANVENLTLTGSGDIDGTGNALKNTITGNSGANVLHGGGDIDTLSGLGGADTLYGDAGNDIIDGGLGDDFVYGGAGADRLTGGAGADTFVFTDLDIHRFSAGSGLVEKDTITDLSFAANDRIDLSAIDANVNLAGDQAFAFAAKFTKVAGQAVLGLSGGVTTLQLDVDGDGRADFSIAINGDLTGTTANLYTGGGDTNGGWVL